MSALKITLSGPQCVMLLLTEMPPCTISCPAEIYVTVFPNCFSPLQSWLCFITNGQILNVLNWISFFFPVCVIRHVSFICQDCLSSVFIHLNAPRDIFKNKKTCRTVINQSSTACLKMVLCHADNVSVHGCLQPACGHFAWVASSPR